MDMVKQRDAGLFMPPKKKRKKVPLVMFGKLNGSAWGASLHDDEVKNGSVRGATKGEKTGDSS